jgi:hypothetical protein
MNISKFENCFPEELATRLHKFIANTEWRYGWRSSAGLGYGHWNRDFAHGGTENGIDCSDRLKDQVILDAWNYLKAAHYPNAVLLRCYANGHTFGVEGYPHIDSERDHDQTIVTYMNKTWKREWGGETVVYQDNQIVHSELPQFNSALVFGGTQTHQARSVTRICPDLRMTLMFKFSMISDSDRDRIQKFLTDLGADKIPHSGRNLLVHLLRVYDLLKAQGCRDVVCRAGALHSIFGNNHFKHATIDIRNSHIVSDLIGAEAMRLILLFTQSDRPRAFESRLETGMAVPQVGGGIVVMKDQEFDDLCAIEAANLEDQSCLAQYPRLQAKWKKLKG